MEKTKKKPKVKTKENNSSNPRNVHDIFFKKVFMNTDVTRDFLQNYLPKEIVDLIDLSQMEQKTDHFIDGDLSQYFADLLYSVKLNGREAYLYILFEHKSYDDRQVVFQMLEYISKIYRKHKLENPNKKVPVVIPIVIFHASENWKQPFNLLEYMDLDLEKESSLIQYVPNFTYKFYDITGMKKEELHGTNILMAVLIALKLKGNTREFTLEEIVKKIDVVGKENYEIFKILLKYMSIMVDADKKSEFFSIIKDKELEMKEDYMTLAQSWENDGIAKGIEQGRAKGRAEGKLEEKFELAKNLLGLLPDEVIAEKVGLPISEIKKLKS